MTNIHEEKFAQSITKKSLTDNQKRFVLLRHFIRIGLYKEAFMKFWKIIKSL